MAHGGTLGGAVVNRRKHQVAARMRAHKRWQTDEVQRLNAGMISLSATIAATQRAWLHAVEVLPGVLVAWQQAVGQALEELLEALPGKLAEWQTLADGLITRHVERLEGSPDPYRAAAWWRL